MSKRIFIPLILCICLATVSDLFSQEKKLNLIFKMGGIVPVSQYDAYSYSGSFLVGIGGSYRTSEHTSFQFEMNGYDISRGINGVYWPDNKGNKGLAYSESTQYLSFSPSLRILFFESGNMYANVGWSYAFCLYSNNNDPSGRKSLDANSQHSPLIAIGYQFNKYGLKPYIEVRPVVPIDVRTSKVPFFGVNANIGFAF